MALIKKKYKENVIIIYMSYYFEASTTTCILVVDDFCFVFNHAQFHKLINKLYYQNTSM